MQNLTDERKFKNDKIMEAYLKRNDQNDIAKMFSMEVSDVALVTKANNCTHTRMITLENRRENEFIKPLLCFDELEFLDQYPLENFKK